MVQRGVHLRSISKAVQIPQTSEGCSRPVNFGEATNVVIRGFSESWYAALIEQQEARSERHRSLHAAPPVLKTMAKP